MKIAIGPKGRQTMFAVIFGYAGPGKRWGKINFGNGFTLRAGSVALHIWKPRGVALGNPPTSDHQSAGVPNPSG